MVHAMLMQSLTWQRPLKRFEHHWLNFVIAFGDFNKLISGNIIEDLRPVAAMPFYFDLINESRFAKSYFPSQRRRSKTSTGVNITINAS
jgi:hypothetical protein